MWHTACTFTVMNHEDLLIVFFVRIHKQAFLFLFRLISKNSLLHMILLWLILFDPIILLNMIHFLQNLHWNDCFPVNQWCFSWWLVLLQCKVETFSFFEDSFYVLPFVVLSPVILLLSFTIHMLLAFMLLLLPFHLLYLIVVLRLTICWSKLLDIKSPDYKIPIAEVLE